ncbi:MAG: glycosyltransferase family 39 protein [Flavobacteriales bacterium]|nr:glycosyltransferase family 39 protein [Flavobacteriales bacterium]
MSILKGVLFFSVLVLGVTEILSLFKSLNYISILLCWSVIDLIIIYFLIRRKSFNTLSSIKIKLKNSLKSLSGLEKFLIGFSVFLLLGIFVQGLIYPANNWDSMAYHMARIVHWIQNESLAYYRTPVYPQLNSPPFSEELILNINLLAGNDYFSNVVSLFYLLATSVTVSLVAKYLGLNKFGQILSVFILICIPEVILLGSSTHNEIVVSFFMVSSIYFFIKILKQQAFISFLLLGCSLGLAVATKSTAYIYIGPFVLIWFVVQFYQIITKKQQLKWIYYLVILLSFIVVNIGHYSRNYQLTSTIFGTDEVIRNYYVNEEHSIRMMISNVSRNLSNQFGAPKIAPIAQGLTEDLHQLIEVDVNELKFTSHTYGVDPLATHENNGANPYHMVLMLMSCFWFLVFIRKQDKRITVYWIAIVLSFLLFCFYLKWQPWAKLHAPFFIFYAIVLSHFLIHTFKKKLLLNIIVFGFVINALLILIFNYSRPYITYSPYTSTIKITDSRYKKSFSRFLYAYSDYEMVAKKLKEYKLKNIGLMFGDYDLEYQLFIDSYRSDVRPIHINSCMLSEGIPVKYEVDCIVSAKYEDLINYDGETFYNVTKDSDGYLYLFLKQ